MRCTAPRNGLGSVIFNDHQGRILPNAVQEGQPGCMDQVRSCSGALGSCPGALGSCPGALGSCPGAVSMSSRDIHNHSHGTRRTGSVRLEGVSLPLTVVFSTAVRLNGRVRALLSLREQCPGQ
jgi:hypothetical protein